MTYLTRIRPLLPLILVIAGALIIRVCAVLMTGERLGFDDIISLSIASKPFSDMGRYLAVENHPPLHFYLLHFWIAAFGASPFALKLSSVIAAVGGVMATWGITRRLFDARAAFAASLLVAFSSFHILFTTDVRMYAWLYLFSVLSFWSFWELLRHDRWWVRGWWLAATVTALYTHLGAVFVVGAEVIYYFSRVLIVRIFPRCRDMFPSSSLRFKTWASLVVAACAAWAPWLISYARDQGTSFGKAMWYFWVTTARPFPIEATHRFLLFDNYSPYLDFFGWVLVGAGLAAALIRLSRTTRGVTIQHWIDEPTLYVLIIYLFPLTIGFFFHVWVIKYYMAAAVGLYALLGKGLARLAPPWGFSPSLLASVLAFFLIASSIGVVTDVRPAWLEAGNFLNAHHHDADHIIVLTQGLEVALRYYYHGETPLASFYPPADYASGDPLYRSVRRYPEPLIRPATVPLMDAFMEGKQKVWVFNALNFREEQMLMEWFSRNGWILRERKGWVDYFVNPEVSLWERPLSPVHPVTTGIP